MPIFPPLCARLWACYAGASMRGRLILTLLPVLAVLLTVTCFGIWSGRLPPPVMTAVVCLTAAAAAAGGWLAAGRKEKAAALPADASILQAVYRVAAKAGRSLDLQEVLDATTSLTVEVTGVRACSVKLREASTGAMRVRSISGMRSETMELTVDASESIHVRNLLDGKSIRIEGAAGRDFPEVDGESGPLVCVPLRHEGKVLGAICVYGRKGAGLPPDVTPFLSALGDLVVLSIRSASAYEELQRMDQAKTSFLLKASHELKSPLSGIVSICQTILGGYVEDAPARQREMIGRIKLRSERLLETARDLLALARARSKPSGSRSGTVDLSGALRETMRFYQTMAAEKNVALDASTPGESVPVSAAEEEITSVMGNLVSNAIKYSRPGTAVSAAVGRDEGGPILRVRDRGIGIPDGEKDGLFKEFFRAANARSLTEEGTGLGLVIVKSIVDGLGGSIALESREGGGTEVTVRFREPGT